MTCWVMGLGLSDHDCSAVLMHGAEIVVGVAKERITRRKRHGCDRNDFDDPAVRYCLDAAGIGIEQVDLVVQNSIFPFLSNPSYYETLDHYPRSVGTPRRLVDLRLHPVRRISHHLAHAYAAYWLSPFEEAVVLVVDAMGNEDLAVRDFFEGEDSDWLRQTRSPLCGAWERESCYTARGAALEPLWKRMARNDPPYDGEIHGFGIMYHDVSEYIFGDGHEAGQTMGLAPWGDPAARADLRFVLPSADPPHYRFDGSWLAHLAPAYRPKTDESRRGWNTRWDEFRNLAAKVQEELEAGIISLCRRIHEEVRIDNLCFAGGVALNSVLNKKILDTTPFRRLFVPPAAGDSGIALGCALYGFRILGGHPRRVRYARDYLGRPYRDEEIVAAISESGASVVKHEHPAVEAAKLLHAGRIVGWFQGGSEFGPRALGNRSILCAPRPEGMRDQLNARVKHRAPFRPFAPSVLAEYAEEYFDLGTDSPVMLLVASVREEKRAEIPAVVHVDGTCRIQTVSREQNPLFYELIAAYRDLSGTPVVLNTSFNDHGEPIVESPRDALASFAATDLDALFLGEYLVTRHR